MQQPPMTPMFQMGISSQQIINDEMQKKLKEMPSFPYTAKFKTSVYAFILFIVLSHKVFYKIINIIFGIFTSRNDIINHDGDPMPLGVFINAFIMAILLFFL